MTTSTRPGIATNTKSKTATGSNARTGPRNESTQHLTPQVTPQTQYLAPQSWEGDSKTLPRCHSTRAQQWPRDNASDEIGNPSYHYDDIGVVHATNETSAHRGVITKYPHPRIKNPTTPFGHAMYNLPGHGTVSPGSGVNCYSSHEQQIPWDPQMSDPGDQTRAPRHRFLKAVTIVDDEDTDRQAVKVGANNLQEQCTNESEHKKRRHTTRGHKSAR